MKIDNLPQNGIPWGDHVPFSPHTRRAGPRSSKPRSHVYSAIAPVETVWEAPGSVNCTVLWAGAPGNPQLDKPKQTNIFIIECLFYGINHILINSLERESPGAFKGGMHMRLRPVKKKKKYNFLGDFSPTGPPPS